eukprot:TRINITY_DN41_c1_g1_i1.p1 TRINITY_DN41_c1_g1~~TRINITY_DN41_c1_g1_i1.p1  ORF type:complete len:237 (+),score=61.16 TRINITY_DN41_c1_g1_i1:61-771(+)
MNRYINRSTVIGIANILKTQVHHQHHHHAGFLLTKVSPTARIFGRSFSTTTATTLSSNKLSKRVMMMMMVGCGGLVSIAVCETSSPSLKYNPMIPTTTNIESTTISDNPFKPTIKRAIAKDMDRAPISELMGPISFGGLVGFAAGYAAKKIGKAVLVVTGTLFIILQFMAYKQYVSVNWRNIASRVRPISSNGVVDESSSSRERSKLLNTIYTVLTTDFPFKAGFATGLLLGFKSG